jgi:hypothetical protein
MKAHPEISRNLRLEALETRTLLAADLSDPFGLVADLAHASQALSGAGFGASFDTHFGNHFLVVTGGEDSSLTINLDQLPSYITGIQLSSFESVTVTGTDHVERLLLRDIGSMSATGLNVDGALTAQNTGSLSLAAVEGNIAVSGDKMTLSIDKIGELSLLVSDVDDLTFSSQTSEISMLFGQREQTLRLTSNALPSGWHISGWDNSRIHVILPSVDQGNSDTGTDTPTVPVDSGSNSGGSGSVDVPTTPSAPDTSSGPDTHDSKDEFVIITHPLDEQTRLFLEQISRLLHSSDADAGQRVLDLLDQSGIVTPNGNVEIAAQNGGLLASNVLRTAAVGSFSSVTKTTSQPYMDVSKFANVSGELALWTNSDLILSRAVDAKATLPDNLSLSKLVDVDLSWPVSLSPSEPPHVTRSAKNDSGEIREVPIEDSVRALGSYIVDRVVAEFSPGQQSLVLLVDPQPTRSPAGSKKSPALASLDAVGFSAAVTEI